MAAEDIYEVKMNFEAPSGSASTRVYYQQTIDATAVENPNKTLADAWVAFLAVAVNKIISSDWWFPSICVSKITGLPAAMYRHDFGDQPGSTTGPSLPANNSLLFELAQSLFTQRSNGKIYFPGVSENGAVNGVISNAFMTVSAIPLAVLMVQVVPEVAAGAARYQLGVVSAKVRDAALPFKDWDAAFADVVSVSPKALIATQRRRQTEVTGASV
jgi:hypothetical protein